MAAHAREDDPASGRLGLGCAGLFGLPSSRERIALIHEAMDHGIAHFDVAPMYGLGIAEQELGRALRGRREQVTVASKFGIEARGWTRAAAHAQGPLRAAAARFQRLNTAARAHAVGPGVGFAGSILYRSAGFDAPAARRGLTLSLRRLRVDHLDLLLLHDPGPDVELTGVYDFLQGAVRQGLIRSWGIAGEPGAAILVADRLPAAVPTLQLRWDSFQPQAVRRGESTLITFGALGSALPRLERVLSQDPDLRSHWSDVLGLDCSRREHLAALLLDDALAQNPRGITLFSTTRSSHLRAAAERLQRPSHPGRLDDFRKLIARIPADEEFAA